MTIKNGDCDALVMRKIGVRHALMMPPREAQLVDVDILRRQLKAIDQQLGQIAQQRTELEAKRSDLAGVIAQFDAATVDRQPGDPETPQIVHPIEAAGITPPPSPMARPPAS